MLEKIQASLENIDSFFTKIGDIFNDPAGELLKFLYNFFKELLETISIVSFDWLVVIGLIALVLSIFGWDKGKKVGMMCPAIYIIIQILAKVICHA